MARVFRCTKCSSTDANVRYVSKDDNLACKCAFCGYAWTEDTTETENKRRTEALAWLYNRASATKLPTGDEGAEGAA